ncbi:MAG: fructose-1,6-bisphosphate aldolase [Alphaproteobacteria bacterium]|nr:MAG: fructose-1,6-bisphosphate aldolase [Alphaproteobacteria bacterium]
MARITLRQLLDHAAEHEYGVPAFNLNNMEQGLAIMAAADATDSPVILQASKGARAYANDIVLAKLIDGLVEIYPHIPVCMHLDHGSDEATCATAIQYGFTSVMMDGSLKADGKTPADYNYNVEITRNVTKMAHWAGVSVEGELGVLGSLESGQGEAEDGHGAEGVLSHDQLLTDPDEAVKFVEATKVDALAVAMGTSHGAYKFTRKPDGDVLAMKEIQRGIKHGVRKINIDTDNRMAMTGQIRKILAENKAEFDPRKYLKPAMEAMTKLCKQRFEEFGTAGQGSKIRPVSVATMAKRYANGSLDPKISAAG